MSIKYFNASCTHSGLQTSNYFGSICQASTVTLGTDAAGRDVNIPLRDLLPMVQPNDIVFDGESDDVALLKYSCTVHSVQMHSWCCVVSGWDISSLNLAEAMERAQVFDVQLQDQLRPHMAKLRPRPSVYYPDFIAANQSERADNVLSGSKWEHVERIRSDIRDFKSSQNLDKVIVLWTANTERFVPPILVR